MSHASQRLAGGDDSSPESGFDALLRRAGRGDRDAFAALYDRMSGRVFGLVLHVLRDHAEAEEVAQEALVDVWRRAARFDPDRGSATAWVLTIAHRRAVDRVRASQSQSERDHLYELRRTPAPEDPTAEEATRSVDSARIRRAVAHLSSVQQEVLELAYFEGRTHREIAEQLDIPLGTAKTRIRDGLRRLGTTLGEEGDDSED